MAETSRTVLAARDSLVEEMASGDLGDARLNNRRDRLVQVLERHPDVGFPEACGSDSEAEALYRFLRNPRVSLEAVIDPHVAATCRRCAALGEVLVLHDTTEQSFTGEAPRAGLTRQSQTRQGFLLHAALAVSADGLRAPLGLLSLVPFVHTPRPAGTPKPSWRARFADPEKESTRWGEGVAAVRTRFGSAVSAIHIMDREGDSYELLAALAQQHDRFVVRVHHDRRIVDDTGTATTLADALPRTAPLCEQEVTLAPRLVGDRSQRSRTKHPPRAGRRATLRFAARRLVLQRPATVRAPHPPALAVHVVYAWEVHAPAGETPVEWWLATTEPITTVAQVLQIVEWYRTRWLIEEFFKALKTGCAYEQRQLESLETLVIALALLAPIAWQLLLLRYLARELETAPATVVLSRRQIQILRAVPVGARLTATPTIRDALVAVARLGGHLRQNGEPGWLVLGRGMEKLRGMEAGWTAAEHARRCDQS